MTPIQLLAEWALRSSLLIASGALLLWALRIKDPCIRWAAWTALLCASLAIPALHLALPNLPFVVMRAAPARVEAPLELPPVVYPPTLNPTRAAPPPEVSAESPATIISKPFDWVRAALMIYVFVALALLLRLCLGLAISRRLLRNSRATGEATEGIEIRESDRVATPVAMGIVRSIIVLPGDWRAWDAAKLSAVLAHERSHIQRRDPAVQLLSAIHRALLWHSPLSWFLHRRIVRTAEEASDDAALAVTGDRALYAEMLLGFMQRGVRGPDWQSVPMARYGRADKRIHRILDGTVLSRGVTRWSLTAILVLGLPLACVVAAAHPQSAQQTLAAHAHPGSARAVKPIPNKSVRIAANDNSGGGSLPATGPQGKPDVIPELSKGADIEARDEYGATPLILAAHYSDAEAVKILLDRGANVEASDQFGSTALLLAAEQGKTDEVKLLLDHGANLEDKDQYASTPLLRAAYGSQSDTVKLLLERGANTEAHDKGGRTALLLAIQARSTGMVNLLLEKGASINAPGNSSPLLWAARENMTEIEKLLLERGASPDVVDEDGMMPLTMAAGAGNIEMVKLLIEKGVHVADYGSTALFRARNTEILNLLLDNGAHVDARDALGDTLLIASVRQDKIDVMKLLIDRGADIEAKNKEGMTALMWAAFWGHVDIVKLLLDRGSQVNANEGHGQTALTFATSGPVKNPEVLDLLRARGAK